jgi:DNA transposition AAA+ family ATPase
MFANLANFQSFYNAFFYLQESGQSEKMIVVHGLPGMGKTDSIIELAKQVSGVYHYCAPSYSPKSFCEEILYTCNQQPSGTVAAKLRSISNYLRVNNLPLFLDDCDNIAHHSVLLEMVRAIHDRSGQPVVMTGMDNFIQRLSKYPQTFDRAHVLEFKGIILDDVRKLTYALSKVAFADDLCAEILKVSQGKTRLAARSIGYVNNWAIQHSYQQIDLNLWGDLPLLPQLNNIKK